MNPVALTSVKSPLFLMTSSTSSELGLAWISLIKFVNLLHGIK